MKKTTHFITTLLAALVLATQGVQGVTVTGWQPVQDVVVTEGISRSDLPLPHVVVLKTSSGDLRTRVDIFPSTDPNKSWSETGAAFNGTVPGVYPFRVRGYVDTSLYNPYNLFPEVNVVVREAGILSFLVRGQIGASAIDGQNRTIHVKVLPGTDLSTVNPIITLTDSTSCNPTNGDTVDFSNGPVAFSVTAKTGTIYQWNVSVDVASNIQEYIYVSPTGADSNPGTEDQPYKTIERARDYIRTINQNMTGDIIVYLRCGDYPITQPIELDNRDSGSNGHYIVYAAYPGEIPVITGGKKVDGWIPAPDKPGAYKAPVPIGIDYARELYVNCRRARVARDEGTPVNGWGGYDNPAMSWYDGAGFPKQIGGYTVHEGYQTTSGYAYNDMASWRNISDIEFGYYVGWTFHLIPVQDIQNYGSGIAISMKPVAFELVQTGIGGTLSIRDPNFVQNAFELLDEPGESYFDRTSRFVYYIPREGEDIESIEAYLPATEDLLLGSGQSENPIRGLVFSDLTFQCSGYNRPNSAEGAVTGQASFLKTTAGKIKMPAAVSFDYAHDITLINCAFAMIGKGAVDFDREAQNNAIVGCIFDGIGSSAIQLGDPDGKHAPDSRASIGNKALANKLYNIGETYNGAVGIWAGCIRNTIIAYNDLRHVSYSGISCGWSWGYSDPTVAANNIIEYNQIQNVLEKLHDGGGIYVLGYQPGSRIRGNHVHDNTIGAPGGIYLDEGSSGYIDISGNVVYRISDYQKDTFFINQHVGYWSYQPDRALMVNHMTAVMYENYPHNKFTYPGTTDRINPIGPDMSLPYVVDTLSKAGNHIAFQDIVQIPTSCVFARRMGSDGYADRVIIRDDGHGNAMWSIDASSNAGFGDGIADVTNEFTFGLMTDTHLLGDVNGDGYIDRIYARKSATGWDYAVDFSTIAGFGDGVVDTAHSFGGTDLIPVAVVDWNGDGLADRIGARPQATYLEWIINLTTATTNGGGAFTTGSADVSVSHGAPDHRALGACDLDGDGTVDLVVKTSYNFWAANNGWASSFYPLDTESLLGDLNNDGYVDRVVFSENSWVADYSTAGGWGDGNVDLATTTLAGDKVLLADIVSLGVYPSYTEWIADFGLTGSDTNYMADLEYGGMGDGMNNLLEYMLGGNPTQDDAAAIMPTTPRLEESGGTNYMVYVYRRRVDAAQRGLTYAINYNFNLETDPWTSASNTFETGSSLIDSEFESVTNHLPTVYSNATFFKLEITVE